MPARDASSTISQAIASIQSQTLKNWELIVVNDGSVDDTELIVQQHEEQDDRIRLISGVGAGEPAARNMGIEVAVGEWIAMMDADDVARPHRLERQLHFVKTHPDLFVAASQATLFVDYGTPLGRSSASAPTTTRELDELKERRHLFVLCHPTFMFNAEKLRDLGGYDTAFMQACDTEVINRAVYLHNETLLMQPEELIWYRIAAGGMSTKGLALQRRVLRYLEYRNESWMAGDAPVSLSVWLESSSGTGQFRHWRHDAGAVLYRQAGILVGKRAWVRAFTRLIGALVLHPRYVMRKLRSQQVTRALPWIRRE
jgi:glycosyltransferase involved in cell wall biosynthesis